MIHSADKMKAEVQRAIARCPDSGYTRLQRISAYVRVQGSTAYEMYIQANLATDDAWKLYYCDNLSIGKISDVLQTDVRSVKLLIYQSAGTIARSFLEGETISEI